MTNDLTMIGSLAEVPKDLLNEVRKLEELFTVPASKLKEITTHFVSELEKGLFDSYACDGFTTNLC